MSADDLTAAPKTRTKPSRKASALQPAIVARIRDSLLPGDAPDEGAWVEEAAHVLLELAAHRPPETPVIEIASENDERRYLRIAIVNDDMPFLVDSVAAVIAEAGLVIDRLAHPVVRVERDAKGDLVALPEEAGEGARRESMIYIETARADARQRRDIQAALETTLADVRIAVADWPKMVEAMDADADRVDDAEGAELLRWFAGGMLT